MTLQPRQQNNGGPPVAPTECHQFQAYHTDVHHKDVYQWWTISGKSHAPSDCHLRATGSPPVACLPLVATGGPLE